MIEVAPGTICVFGDIACPWARLAMHRLNETRARVRLEDSVAFDLRAFPLELINERSTPKQILDVEVPVAAELEPGAGWSPWTRRTWEYPVTTLLAMEAVHAAKEQSLQASERLDLALRTALFRDSRCVSLHHVVIEVAEEVDGVDAKMLEDALVDGSHRRNVFEDLEVSRRAEVEGSPHLFLTDGGSFHNPGIDMSWEGGEPGGKLTVRADRPEIYEEILRRAAEEGGAVTDG